MKRTDNIKVLLRQHDPAEVKRIVREFGVSELCARILSSRGFKADQELETFLNPSLKRGLPDPSNLKGLNDALKYISRALSKGEKIAICSDFDVDGVTGCAQMYDFLRRLGAKVSVFIPDRFIDGYGLNERMVEQIFKEGYKLIIAIDFGTTNIKELRLAREKGIKTVVIDHHHVEVPPPADVFINPKQKGCGFAGEVLCASGLCWFVVCVLNRELGGRRVIDPKNYLDLASLGTICDMVPLLGANRVIAKRGLELLTNSKRVGIIALKKIMGLSNKPISCYNVSFGFGPRINAAGRLVHAKMVVELLTTEDEKRAEKIAQRLERLNKKRQDIEKEIKEKAEKRIIGDETDIKGIVVADKRYHTGVIGIVAQRLVESFYRPSAVLGEDEEGIFKGSVRGIKGFSVVEALSRCEDLLVKYGGHEGAGGFSILEEHLDAFVKRFNEVCCELLKDVDLLPTLVVDTTADLSELTIQSVEEIRGLAPFGIGNPGPNVLLKGVKVCDIYILKDAHLKVRITDGAMYYDAFLWRATSHPYLSPGVNVDLVVRPDINVFNNQLAIQMSISSVMPTDMKATQLQNNIATVVAR